MDKKKKFCLVGKGISYSLSPKIHRQIYDILGANAEYVIEDVGECEIPRVIAEYDGFNVTKPYKLAVRKYLDSAVESVNTVTKQDGKAIGFSTDGDGFIRALKKTGGDGYSHYAVVGSGGAALAVINALKSMGKTPNVFARNQVALEKICDMTACKKGENYSPQAVIYCASGGEYLPFDTKNTEYLMDLRYDGSEISLDGAVSVNGLRMLVSQAVLSAEKFLSVNLGEKRIDEIVDIIYNSLCKYKK